MTGHAAIDQAARAEVELPQVARVGLTMLGSVAVDSATTVGQCDDGYCAVP